MLCPRIMSNKLKAVLIDLSGTIHIDNSQIPGAVESLRRLRETDLKIRFVTNTTKESSSSLYARLTSLGFDISREEIFSSLSAARSLVDRRQLRPLLLLAAEAMEDFRDVQTQDPNAVLVGLAPDKFNYDSLTQAFRLVLDGAALIAIHKARYFQRGDGLALGPGPFVTGLEYATGRPAEVVGKPNKHFFLTALDGLGCLPEQAVMIGDDAGDDVGGAQAAGLRGILVRTGKYRPDDESSIEPAPWHTAPSFTEAVQFILDQLNSAKAEH